MTLSEKKRAILQAAREHLAGEPNIQGMMTSIASELVDMDNVGDLPERGFP